MEEILDRCCGLDVHRDTIVACIMIGEGKQKRKYIKTFRTFTSDIQELAKWLKSYDIKHVVIESTGIYWKPIFNIFEADFQVILCNPKHIKNVPGRKSDVKDSEWLCKVLKCGMAPKSFIPVKAIVRLREVVRYRQTLVRDLSRAKNRIIKMLENANIKLSSVFSDVFGLTAWRMITKLVDGETKMEVLMEYIHGRCKSSRDDIQKALQGTLEDEDRKILKRMMSHIKALEKLILEVENDIRISLQPYEIQAELLTSIPGVETLAAASIIAEIGIDMNQFHSDSHLTAWAGLCPSSNESGGKIKSSRIRKGNRHLKVVLSQVAWAISRTKHTYLGSKYRALAPKRGKKRAIIAIARKTLVICYHMLKQNVPFHELGEQFLDNIEPTRKAKYYEKRLEELGYHVQITKKVV